jgi:hypothetical protein
MVCLLGEANDAGYPTGDVVVCERDLAEQLRMRPDSVATALDLRLGEQKTPPVMGRAALAAYSFPVVVERSLRFGFPGGILRGLRRLNALYQLLSLAIFVRLGPFLLVFH